jgi:hypothetical protein
MEDFEDSVVKIEEQLEDIYRGISRINKPKLTHFMGSSAAQRLIIPALHNVFLKKALQTNGSAPPPKF